MRPFAKMLWSLLVLVVAWCLSATHWYCVETAELLELAFGTEASDSDFHIAL